MVLPGPAAARTPSEYATGTGTRAQGSGKAECTWAAVAWHARTGRTCGASRAGASSAWSGSSPASASGGGGASGSATTTATSAPSGTTMSTSAAAPACASRAASPGKLPGRPSAGAPPAASDGGAASGSAMTTATTAPSGTIMSTSSAAPTGASKAASPGELPGRSSAGAPPASALPAAGCAPTYSPRDPASGPARTCAHPHRRGKICCSSRIQWGPDAGARPPANGRKAWLERTTSRQAAT